MLTCTLANAQNTFEKIIDTLGSGIAICIQETFDGGYVYCGASQFNGNDAIVVKLDSVGTIEWAKIFSGPGIEGASYIEQTPDSGYIVNATYDAGLNAKNWLLRLDANGDTLWTKTYSLGNGATTIDLGNSMATLNNSLYGLTGYFNPQPLTNLSTYLIVTFTNGLVLDSNIYNNSPYGSTGYAVCKTFDNGFAITGEYSTSTSTADFNFIRTNSSGDTLFTRSYGFSQADVGFDIKQTSDSGFVIAGIFWNSSTFKYNIFLIKTDSVGDTLWTKPFYSLESQGVSSIFQTSDGGFIMAGRIVHGMPLQADLLLIKTDALGDTLWTRFFGDIPSDNGYFVRPTKDGGYIIGGTGTIMGNAGAYIIKTDSLGNVYGSTGVAELNNPFEFLVYPNPSSGLVHISSKGLPQKGALLQVINTEGKAVYSSPIANKCPHSFSLRPGIYVALLQVNAKNYAQKFIVLH